ncbi:hypothetical protein H1Z61_02625 [Bacillus aquiflavi]|uniref:Immunity protein 50 n=1 Tax=Bacillus aquiflavi TaxID=2672567 RepID=A0A6B3VYL5_9BACI|nr:immunity 50 family protein [Bacillus aquiflavi]MBA4536060.1 hypothetical protein [Bacillus aquiflavi]NEY80434.1 hypothetical protein [Bacillus aquiflavi]UAC47092.1 immunity 50 family protein [Bacillus aquiflavi]
MISEMKIINPQALTSIFGCIPRFNGSEILEVQLKRNIPIMLLTFMTKEIVQNKPKHWRAWNVIYVKMSFYPVHDIVMNGFGTNNFIKCMTIKNTKESGVLKIKCYNQMQIKCLFDWARIEEITPGLIEYP